MSLLFTDLYAIPLARAEGRGAEPGAATRGAGVGGQRGPATAGAKARCNGEIAGGLFAYKAILEIDTLHIKHYLIWTLCI